MGFMDVAMDSYTPPSAADLEIVLPARREPKKAAEGEGGPESQDLGQHGGAADGSGAATEAHSDVANTSTNAEPEPQRDDPDDGEHTDSTEQEVATRAAAAAQEAAEEPTEAEEASGDAEGELEAEAAPEATSESEEGQKPLTVRQALAAMPGSTPRAFQKAAFSSGEGDVTLTVKRFPLALVDHLRLSLAPVVGGEFAEAMSSPALITAFLMARTGVELDVDVNTAAAAEVFRRTDPRLAGVEDQVTELGSNVVQLANAMKQSLKRLADTADVVDGLEFAMAYLIADRVASLTSADTNETNVDVTQKKVLTARENIRKRSNAQRTIERQRAGRRMS